MMDPSEVSSGRWQALALVAALVVAVGGSATEAWAQAKRGSAPSGLVRSALQSVHRGQHEAAIRQCKQALRRDEKYTPAMEVMARAYYQLGKTEFAAAICDIALGIDPRSAKCHNLKGFVALKEKDPPRALLSFKKATDVNSEFGPGWLNLGAQYLEVKNYRAAVPALEQAVRLMPNRAEAHLNLGAAYRGVGELSKAQQALNRALKLRSNYAKAYFNLGVLFLDAEKFPGLDKLKQLHIATANLNKYKQLRRSRNTKDPVDTYLDSAQREIRREQRRIEREKKRKARDAAKAAKAAKEPQKSSDKGK